MILRAALWSLRLCPRRWELQVLGPLYIVCPCNSGSPGCTTALGPISLQAALRVQWVMAPSATRCACKGCHPSASVRVRLLACCYSLPGSLQTVVAVQMHLLLVQRCTHCCPLSVCSSLTSAVNTINKMSTPGCLYAVSIQVRSQPLESKCLARTLDKLASLGMLASLSAPHAPCRGRTIYSS